jgi:hypothetical protein
MTTETTTPYRPLSEVIDEGHKHFWIYNKHEKARHYGWRLARITKSGKLVDAGTSIPLTTEFPPSYVAIPIEYPSATP